MRKFASICKMSQEQLKAYVTAELAQTHNKVIAEDGFVYAKGEIPVLLVAHLDTVHKSLPTALYYDDMTKALSSPEGIGGDDRCGVYMILKIVQMYNCSVLFCEDEEIGGIGAEAFTRTEYAEPRQFNYIIEFDRRGKNDAVFYHCDNPEFEKFITKDYYKTATGSFSDISILAPYLGVAAVNLSCGYYKAHTTDEYVIMSEMEASIREACRILDRTTEETKFVYIESKTATKWDSWYDSFGYHEEYYMIEYTNQEGHPDVYETFALSEMEAIGMFLMEHPTLTFGDIEGVYSESEMYIN